MAPSSSFRHHLQRTIALALPVTLARAGLVVMMTVDTIFAGRSGKDELAFLGISMSPLLIMVTVGAGIMVGALVLTAQAHGAGRLADCRRIWRLALVIAAILGALYAALQWQGEWLLRSLGEDAAIARGGGGVLRMWALGMPAVMLYWATGSYLEGMSRPLAPMAISLGANLVNLALAWIFVFGHLGMPAMGAAGAALASSITLWVMLLLIAGYAALQPGFALPAVRPPVTAHGRLIGKILLLGLPVALSVGFETAAFSGSGVIAGWLGATTLAAFQLVNNATSFIYMLTLGIGTAAAIRVGNATGRADRAGVSEAGWIAVVLALVLMLAVGTAIWLFRGALPYAYTTDEAVIAAAVPAVGVLSVLVVLDGVQAVLVGALRGAGDAIFPTAVYGIAFGACAIPLSYYFGYRRSEGAEGLTLGLVVGLGIAAVVLALRFTEIARRQPLQVTATAESRRAA
jgi:multidrug resistance protein, MATE family